MPDTTLHSLQHNVIIHNIIKIKNITIIHLILIGKLRC